MNCAGVQRKGAQEGIHIEPLAGCSQDAHARCSALGRLTPGMSGVANPLVAAQRYPESARSHLSFIVTRRERPRPLHSEVGRTAPALLVPVARGSLRRRFKPLDLTLQVFDSRAHPNLPVFRLRLIHERAQKIADRIVPVETREGKGNVALILGI
jgi:hypothetical protein